MTKEELLSKAETILPLLKEYREKRSGISISPQQMDSIKMLMPHILGRGEYDYSCSSCVLNYALTVESWYHREKPKEDVSEPAMKAPQAPKNKKPGRKKQND